MKIKYIFLGFASALMMTSCDLQYDPKGIYSDITEGVTEDEEEMTFKTAADVESYLRDLYQRTTENDTQYNWFRDGMMISDAHSDNAYAGTTGAEVVHIENNAVDATHQMNERMWTRWQNDVAAANRLICNVDNVMDGSLSPEDANCYKAQAMIFRSIVWFDMARMWGNIPLVTEVAGNITADNIEEVFPAYFPEQHTEIEAYKKIEEDMLWALQWAPDQTSDKTKWTKNVARTLLAKIYAEKPIRDYSKVIKYVDELAAEGFDLVEDYEMLFALDGNPREDNTKSAIPAYNNTKESILETHFIVGSSNKNTVTIFGRDWANWDEQFTWAKWVTPSRDLIAAFQSEGDTKRLNSSVIYYSCNWSKYYPADNYPFMFKARSRYSNWIKFRYADLLLLKAEAYIMGENQNLGAAADIIDRVRARVGLGKLTATVRGSKEALLDAYLKERRLELAFEWQRWYDLCRLDKVEEVMNTLESRDSGHLAFVNYFTADSYHFPIPQSVIDTNENFVQNMGY